MALKELTRRRVAAEKAGECSDKTVFINRVAKVVKGGKRFSFTALIVSGDNRGHVGYALGKAGEVPDAIRKGGERARKALVKIPLAGSTIPHEVMGKCGATTVIMKPAAPGTGVIAGSAVRVIAELVGIKDVRTKIIGSSNPYTVVEAAMHGLLALREPQAMASLRGKSVEQIGYTAA